MVVVYSETWKRPGVCYGRPTCPGFNRSAARFKVEMYAHTHTLIAAVNYAPQEAEKERKRRFEIFKRKGKKKKETDHMIMYL